MSGHGRSFKAGRLESVTNRAVSGIVEFPSDSRNHDTPRVSRAGAVVTLLAGLAGLAWWLVRRIEPAVPGAESDAAESRCPGARDVALRTFRAVSAVERRMAAAIGDNRVEVQPTRTGALSWPLVRGTGTLHHEDRGGHREPEHEPEPHAGADPVDATRGP